MYINICTYLLVYGYIQSIMYILCTCSFTKLNPQKSFNLLLQKKCIHIYINMYQCLFKEYYCEGMHYSEKYIIKI